MNKYTFDDAMHVHLFYYKNIKTEKTLSYFSFWESLFLLV